MDHTCDYCESKLNRHVFCSNKHKVAWHRANVTKGYIQVTNGNNEKVSVTKSNKDVIKKVKEVATKKSISMCKHGAMKGLCRKGCND